MSWTSFKEAILSWPSLKAQESPIGAHERPRRRSRCTGLCDGQHGVYERRGVPDQELLEYVVSDVPPPVGR